VAEAVDRLVLVADEEDLRSRGCAAGDEIAWSLFVSWNSSTMIERKRRLSRSRISGLSRRRLRAAAVDLEVER